MKKIIYISLFCLIQIAFVSGQSNDPEKKLNAAIYQEEINGDLQEAIRLYKEIVQEFPIDRPVVAEALYRNGLAYEKLGNLKAMQYYEKVITNYVDQPELVKLAQTRLDRLIKKEKLTVAQLASLQLSELNKVDANSLSVINLYEKGSSIQKGTRLHNSSLSPDGTKMVGMNYTGPGQNVALYDRMTKKIQLITKYDWTSEGHGYTYFPTWSPDGKKVAFMFAGWKGGFELQVSSLNGEIQTLLKNDIEAQIIPRQWSQDGSKILVFKQDASGFYTIGLIPSEGGSFKSLYKTQWQGKLITGIKGDACLSPDGKYVVFSDGPKDNFDLFIMNVKGGTPTLLYGYPTNDLDPIWSPDGKHIMFVKENKRGSFLYALEMEKDKPVGKPFLIKEGMRNVDLENWTQSGVNYRLTLDFHDIHILPMNPETGTPTGNPKPLDYEPTGSNLSPVWSYDGKYLAFISYDVMPEIVIVSTNDKKTRHFPIEAPGFWELIIHNLSWLPDSSGLSLNVMSPSDIATVYHLDIAKGKWQNYTPPLPVKEMVRTEWGPDKNSFIYTKNNSGLFQFNTKTGESNNIFQTKDSLSYPFQGLEFSRDHKKLTFTFKNADKKSNLIVLNLESGEKHIIGQNYWGPNFSPDAKKILAYSSETKEMVVLSLEGKILHEFNIFNYFPGTRVVPYDWSPDGKQLVIEIRKTILETYLMKNVLK